MRFSTNPNVVGIGRVLGRKTAVPSRIKDASFVALSRSVVSLEANALHSKKSVCRHGQESIGNGAQYPNLSGFYASNWFALFAPAGTPKNIIAKLNGAVMSALANPAVRLKFTDLGHEIFPNDQRTLDALRTLQQAAIEKWWPIIKAANIKVE